jgi:hypothetical protein
MSVISVESREGEASTGNAHSHSWWNAGKANSANTIATNEIWTESTGSVEIIKTERTPS